MVFDLVLTNSAQMSVRLICSYFNIAKTSPDVFFLDFS